MARSDIYKRIILILSVIIFIAGIIYYHSINDLFSFLDKEYTTSLSVSAMFFIWGIGFIFCMFFYLLADILDRLEIISAQTTRTTRVLEDNEEKEINKKEKEDYR